MFDEPQSVPLTTFQKSVLLGGCIPFVLMIVILVVIVTVIPSLNGNRMQPLVLGIFILAVLLTGYDALKRLRDFMAGVALVGEDELERLWRSSGKNRRRYGKFVQLGKFTLSREAFNTARIGERHRIIYSPHSRVIWSLDANHTASGAAGKPSP